MKYEPSEGSMMIDISTIKALELVQNLQNPKSKDCLFGLLNETQTPMGARVQCASFSMNTCAPLRPSWEAPAQPASASSSAMNTARIQE